MQEKVHVQAAFCCLSVEALTFNLAKWPFLGSDPLTEPVPEASLAPLRFCKVALSQRPVAKYYYAVGSMMPLCAVASYVAKKKNKYRQYIYIFIRIIF